MANKHLSLLVENEDWLQEGLQRLKPQALLSEESKKHTAKGVRKCRTCRRFRLGHFGRWQSTLGGALHTCHKGICEDFCEATGSCMAAELRLGTPGCSSIQLQPLTTARPLPVPLSQRSIVTPCLSAVTLSYKEPRTRKETLWKPLSCRSV